MLQCRKCGAEFPFKVKIDGKVRNLNGRKYCLTCSPFGSRNRRRLEAKGDGRGTYRTGADMNCVGCGQTKPSREFYRRADWWMSYCKTCFKARSLKAHQMFKVRAIAYKGGRCVDCGEMPHPASMQFHHRDPTEKDSAISKLKPHSFEKAKAELDKCDLLCANCHAIRHAGDGWDKIDVGQVLASFNFEGDALG